MSEMTPEEQAERIQRLQARRGTAADTPSARRKARWRHGMKMRIAASALSVTSFASLIGVMAVGGQSTSTVAAASSSSATTATTAAPATSSSNTGSSTSSSSTSSSGTSSSSTSTRAVTSTKGS